MSSRTSSRSTLTTVPSTISPSLKYLMVSSIAARNASSLPRSSTAISLLALEVASMLLVMWAVAPVDGLSRAKYDVGAPAGPSPAHQGDLEATANLLPTEVAAHECIEQPTVRASGGSNPPRPYSQTLSTRSSRRLVR